MVTNSLSELPCGALAHAMVAAPARTCARRSVQTKRPPGLWPYQFVYRRVVVQGVFMNQTFVHVVRPSCSQVPAHGGFSSMCQFPMYWCMCSLVFPGLWPYWWAMSFMRRRVCFPIRPSDALWEHVKSQLRPKPCTCGCPPPPGLGRPGVNLRCVWAIC